MTENANNEDDEMDPIEESIRELNAVSTYIYIYINNTCMTIFQFIGRRGNDSPAQAPATSITGHASCKGRKANDSETNRDQS